MPTSDASDHDGPTIGLGASAALPMADVVSANASTSAVQDVPSDDPEREAEDDNDVVAVDANGQPVPADAVKRKRGRPAGTVSKPKPKPTEEKALGIEAYLLPKSTITKLAKTAVPDHIKLQKEVSVALTRSSVVFISYLTSLAQEQAAEANVKTIKPEHVLDALPELDWGEADTVRLRKELKKQLKAFRANAKAKKEGKPLPTASTSEANPGRKPGATKEQPGVIEDDSADEGAANGNAARVNAPKRPADFKGKSAATSDDEPEGSSSEDEEDEDKTGVTRLKDDRGGDQEDDEAAEESPIEDDDEDEEEEEDDDDEDDIEDGDEPEDPNDLEDEMGHGLDDRPPQNSDEEMGE